MKILLDECLPRRLKVPIAGYECQTVPEALLGGTKNGELLAIAESRGFQIFLTMDRGLEYQQSLAGRQSQSSFFAPNRIATRISCH